MRIRARPLGKCRAGVGGDAGERLRVEQVDLQVCVILFVDVKVQAKLFFKNIGLDTDLKSACLLGLEDDIAFAPC